MQDTWIILTAIAASVAALTSIVMAYLTFRQIRQIQINRRAVLSLPKLSVDRADGESQHTTYKIIPIMKNTGQNPLDSLKVLGAVVEYNGDRITGSKYETRNRLYPGEEIKAVQTLIFPEDISPDKPFYLVSEYSYRDPVLKQDYCEYKVLLFHGAAKGLEELAGSLLPPGIEDEIITRCGNSNDSIANEIAARWRVK